MKKKKVIKMLEEAKKWLAHAAEENKKLIRDECPGNEKAAFESGIITMQVSAESVIKELIRWAKTKDGKFISSMDLTRMIDKELIKYGGYVNITEEPSEKWPW